ncbi:response regulator [Massilia sp. erpn]|uniref:response regulator n=1 Tax=Massilia sp. erpn TaxID=2738142 RepID=UPI0021084A7B|nr:response regulator [Massilia sp. erpn]UTY60043.1 response regulator [Massilia sp. erpn]
MTGEDKLAACDWSRSPLGQPAHWPHTLRLSVEIMLNSPQAMLLMWGRQQVMLFNDAYIELAGPPSLQAPGGTVPSMLPAAWSWNPAALEQVWDGRALAFRAQPLQLWRGGKPASVGLDLYYTPLRNPTGDIDGILCALREAAPLPAAAAAAQAAASLRILVVEDNLDAQYLVCEMLQTFGHQVQAVARAEDALQRLDASRFDILFSDISLPGMSGVELARLALQHQPGLKIMFASGYGQALLQQLDFPALSLQKPYDIEQLQTALARLAPSPR